MKCEFNFDFCFPIQSPLEKSTKHWITFFAHPLRRWVYFCLESACYKILLIRSSKSLNRCHKDESWKSLISKSWSKQEIVKSTGGIEVGAPKLTYQKLGQNWSVILIGDLRTDRPESPTFLQSRHFACARISGCRHRDVDIGMWMSKWLHAYAICMCTQIFWVFVPELSPRIHYFFALLWGYLLIILSWMNELTQNKKVKAVFTFDIKKTSFAAQWHPALTYSAGAPPKNWKIRFSERLLRDFNRKLNNFHFYTIY